MSSRAAGIPPADDLRAPRGLLALLGTSIFVNYIDRGNLSVAAPLLETELSLTPARLGALLASFFWTYALLQLFGIAGWIADGFPAGAVLAAAFALSSAATAAAGLVSGFTALFITRLLLGASESVAYPCYSKILAAEYAQYHQGLANALLDAGSKLGRALGTFLGRILMAQLEWPRFFSLSAPAA
jgi:MFS family permease